MSPSNQYITLKGNILQGLACVLLVLFIVCPARTVEPAHAIKNLDTYAENDMKAIYLYNFHKFIRWPENACKAHDGQVHQISVIGDSPLEPILKALQEKLKTTGSEIQVIFYGPYNKEMEFECCCLMFIAESERENLSSILDHVAGKPILTVTDMFASMDEGVMITMVMHENKVRWVINRRPVGESGIKMSAKLLDIAVKVIEK